MSAPVIGIAYEWPFVWLSFVVGAAASYVALAFAARMASATGPARRTLGAAGALTMGFGIWGMHFTGMEACRMEVALAYDVATTALSLLFAVLASGLALEIGSRPHLGRRAWLGGAAMMAVAIGAMHYTGMAALRMQAAILYHGGLVVASLAIAFAASLAALQIVHRLRLEDGPGQGWLRPAAALVMSVAICGMHYTGMAAVTLVPMVCAPPTMPTIPGADLRNSALAILVLVIAFTSVLVLEKGHLHDEQAARRAAEAEARAAQLERAEQELAIARRIQTGLLPPAAAIAGFDVAVALVPADEVGGDLVDVLPTPDGGLWLAVGDVTGHGLPAGLIMMMAQSLFTGLVLADPGAGPAVVLARLNRALHHNVQRMAQDAFMTMVLLRHQGDGRFQAAGLHCDVLVWRAAARAVERIPMAGCWIGLLPEVDGMLAEATFDLAPGDVMVLYTDGLIEARNGAREQYDMARLAHALAACADHPTDAIKARLLADVAAFQARQDDDVSLLVVRRQPTPAIEDVRPSTEDPRPYGPADEAA